VLIHEGLSVVEVARQAGRSPTMTLATYAHVFDELAPDDRVSADEQIRRANEEHVPVLCPPAAADEADATKSLQTTHGRSRTRTWDLFLIREAL
jgi:hypothetical protein